MSGRGVVDCDLSGFGIRFRGLPADLEARLRREWQAYLCDDLTASPILELHVERVDRGGIAGAYDPKGMLSDLDAARATFRMDEGDADVDATGTARVRLATGTGRREWFTLLNLFRACLAWRLPARHGALLHAAAIVVAGRGYALVGAAGAGKSTFARVAEEGGAIVVSDDVILVDASGTVAELAGAPLRSTHAVTFRRERWPLAALLFSRHGEPPAWNPVGKLLAHAKLAANLPFVADGVERDARIAAILERLTGRVECAELTFAPDPGFLNLLRPRS